MGFRPITNFWPCTVLTCTPPPDGLLYIEVQGCHVSSKGDIQGDRNPHAQELEIPLYLSLFPPLRQQSPLENGQLSAQLLLVVGTPVQTGPDSPLIFSTAWPHSQLAVCSPKELINTSGCY